MSTRLADYNYELPPELIAQRPARRREDARMIVLRRAEQTIEHARFAELGKFLQQGDLLVLNDSRVVPARHFSDDRKLDFLFLEKIAPSRWKTLVKPGRKFRTGAVTSINSMTVRAVAMNDDGAREVLLDRDVDMHEGGVMPLPPYIARESDGEDKARYQTEFARVHGSLAAPTAGLHFTRAMLERLAHTFVTLHVGTGTFRPVKTEDITLHQMHTERFSISAEASQAINQASRVVAVGTTTVRVLESIAQKNQAGANFVPPIANGATNIFIYPPFEFRIVDALLTNFHLPRSTLLMLVSAFAEREFILRAYDEAIRERYRFYSYGDCMLIL